MLIILLIGGNAYAQTQLPKCVLFGFGNCIGTLRFSNGDIYTGEFNYGKPNGKGAFTYGNGDSYNGTVAEGQRHGSGTYTSAAGDKYVGQFSEGKFEGVGTYYFLANNRSKGDVYTGEFSSNTFNGQGRYTHSNGQVFVGSFVNGRKAVPIVAPETLLAQAEVQRLAEENAKQKAQLESQLEAERRERLAREKQAAAALVAQAEAQRVAEEAAKQKAQLESQLEAQKRERLAREKQAAAALVAQADAQRAAEENAKQKAQLESQLEAERRERLAQEKQAAAALVAQADAQRIAEENAKQKAQLESQLEAERRERLAQEKQATAIVVEQNVQVAPIVSPALAIVVVPAGDTAASLPEAVVTKLEPALASVETAQQLYVSKDSAVKAHQEPASGRSDSNAELKNAVSNLFFTGSLNSTSMTAQLLGWNVDIPSNTTDVPFSLGLGYKLEKNYGLELGYKYHGNQTIFNDAIKFKANSLFAGAYILLPTYSKLDFVMRGGVGVTSGALDVSSTTSVSYSGTAANKYYGAGAKYEISENDRIFIGLTRFKGLIPVSTLSFDLTLDVIDIGLEHSF